MDFIEEKQQWAKSLPYEETGSGLHSLSLGALLAAPDPSPYQDGMCWGPWRLDLHLLTLTHTEGYEIDLEELTTCPEMLDTIFQVSTKAWCTREALGCFVEALEDLLDPQANLCSFGAAKKFSASRYLKQRRTPEIARQEVKR